LLGKEEVPRPTLAIDSVVYFMVTLPRITASWRSSSRRTRIVKIVSKRRREATSVRQLQCPWSALCSYRNIGKRGAGEMGFMLTVQYEAHENHQLVDDPFTFPAHLKSSEEFQEALRQAVTHRSHLDRRIKQFSIFFHLNQDRS
jgi:hypothetical protein